MKSLRASLRTNRTPIIVIASPGNEDDCIRTLEDGADDYMTTPFSHAELFARMNAIVRSQHTLALESVVVVDGLSLNPETRRIFITDSQTRREIFLRQNEFEILKLLLKHKNQTLSREAIIKAIWGTSGQVLPRIIDVSIYRIRKGLRSAGRERMIETIPNQGYRLVAHPAAAPPP